MDMNEVITYATLGTTTALALAAAWKVTAIVVYTLFT